MRELTNADRIEQLMTGLARAARAPATLAKLERAHEQDLADAGTMRVSGLVDATRLLELFTAIEPALYRFPAIDPRGFRRRVERFVTGKPIG